MFDEIVSKAKTIAIGGHVRPDGDCVGSCMAIYNYLRENYRDKEVTVYLEPFPETFFFLAGTNNVKQEIPSDKVYDLFISLDLSSKERLGFSRPLLEKAKDSFCIDHHLGEHIFANHNYVKPDASSTCELIYQLLDKDRISKEVASALYLGIIHDTGVFRYSNTAPSTYRAAAILLEKGIDASRIITETFFRKTYEQNQVLGRCLLESRRLCDKQVIFTYMTKKTMDFYNVTTKELDGIVNQLLETQGIKLAIFMYELENSEYKVSLRSADGIDANKIAMFFGGGGHKKAAGFNMCGTPFDIVNNVTREFTDQLKEPIA